jgi:hypothetical protein
MVETKHAILALPVIGGIIALIALFLPWAMGDALGMTFTVGLLDLTVDMGPYGTHVYPYSHAVVEAAGMTALGTAGLLAIVFVILGMVIMIIGGLLVFLEKLKGKMTGLLILIGGLLALLAPILWSVGITADTADFFEIFPMQIAFFLPIIGGIIGIAAGAITVLKIE